MPKRHEQNVVVLNRAKIRKLREDAGLSMDEAATLARFTGGRQQWYLFETAEGKSPTITTVFWIAAALGVSIDNVIVKPARAKIKRYSSGSLKK